MRNEDGNVSSFSDRSEMEMSGRSDVNCFSGPVNSSAASAASVLNYRNSSFVKKKAKFNLSPSVKCTDDDSFVEVTIDIQPDSVAVHGVQSAAGADRPPDEDPEIAVLAGSTMEKKSSFRPSLLQSTSTRIKHVSKELKRFASLSRRQSTPRFDRNKSAATHALKGLKFIAAKTGGDAGWPSVDKRFDELTASTNGLLPSSLFGECIGMNRDCKEFAGELFRALAQRRHISGDSISKTQLREFWERIADDSFDSRLQTFFDMVDRDADGRITEEEVEEIICLSASANKLSNIQNQAKEYASLIMEELDPGQQGYIMVYNLETLLIQAPNQSVRVSDTRVLSQMLSQKLMPSPENNPLSRWYEMSKYFLLDNWQRVWVIMLWLSIMAGLFAYKFVQYRNKAAFQVMGYCVSVAKGGAEMLKFNMALILLPVCRNTITWLRNETKLGRVVPFDDNLNFHKVIALGIAAGIGLHASAHLACDFPRLLSASAEKYESMIQYFGEQPTSYWWFVKGVEGVTGVVMVVLMAIAFTLATPWFRKNKLRLPKPLHKLTGFNAFWYSHHLFFIVYTLLIVHGIKLYLTKIWYQKTTWMYLAVPVLIYATERLIREFRSSIEAVEILKVAVYPGNVLALHMSKPRAFNYQSGQYMFVNCAAVSPFEWHPFSITSAPDDDYLSLHIRTLGDWTGRLKAVFSEVCQRSAAGKSGLLSAEFGRGRNSGPELPKIRIDGPYGAPAQDYKKYEVVLLVGLGIGATPMISIVKDIINNIKCPEAEAAHAVESGTAAASSPTGAQKKNRNGKGFGTRKAYFYWVTREQGSFEWFKEIMNEVAETDEKHTIELHNYCTSVYEEGDARSALIAMLQSLHHAKNGVDVVSGTRVKSHFAKPNLREVFKKIALQHPDSKIGVFYCGGPGLMKELRQLASDFSHKTSTKFEFHKENF